MKRQRSFQLVAVLALLGQFMPLTAAGSDASLHAGKSAFIAQNIMVRSLDASIACQNASLVRPVADVVQLPYRQSNYPISTTCSHLPNSPYYRELPK